VAARLGLEVPAGEQAAFAREIYDDIVGFGPLEPLLARDDINEIMINGLAACFVDTAHGLRLYPNPIASTETLTALCQRIAGRAGRRIDQAHPVCDARLPDGSRVNIVFPPVAVDGPILTIRKFPKFRPSLDDLVASGSLSARAAALLRLAVAARANILVTGGASSGKTTLLNCLGSLARDDERIVTCEDVAELSIAHAHVVRLETRVANAEQAGRIAMQDLVRNALRMRPDRIIVGEVRGAEAADLLQAMNTGHDGSMGTLHANSPADAIARLQALVAGEATGLPLAVVSAMIAGAVDLIVHMTRRPDGTRRLTQIVEVTGYDGEHVALDALMGPRRPALGCRPDAPVSRLARKAKAAGAAASLQALTRARQGAAR
jgi:pilus assembly protein CpaF